MIDKKELEQVKETVATKLVSGRFILTIVAAIVFFQITDCICCILISKSDEISISDLLSIGNMLLIIISNIFTFYFTRERLSATTVKKDEPENNCNNKTS